MQRRYSIRTSLINFLHEQAIRDWSLRSILRTPDSICQNKVNFVRTVCAYRGSSFGSFYNFSLKLYSDLVGMKKIQIYIPGLIQTTTSRETFYHCQAKINSGKPVRNCVQNVAVWKTLFVCIKICTTLLYFTITNATFSSNYSRSDYFAVYQKEVYDEAFNFRNLNGNKFVCSELYLQNLYFHK